MDEEESVAIGVTAQVDALSIEMGIITARRVRGAMAREDEPARRVMGMVVFCAGLAKVKVN